MKPYYEEKGITIYHGDCREILPTLEPVDLVLTDPPYGIERFKKSGSRLYVNKFEAAGLKWDKRIPNDIIRLVIGAGLNAILWGGNYYTLPPAVCFLIWDKLNDGRSFAECEYAWTNLKGLARNFKMRPMNMDGGKVHPTQKPSALFKWCIGLTPQTKTVLDPFAGSGTTLRAAKDLGLRAIGIEIEEKYCEIAAERLRQSVFDFEGAA